MEIKNIEIKSITKIGTEYTNKKFTQNHQKIHPKEDEIEIKRIKMKKFSVTNKNFKLNKNKMINDYNNIMLRQNTFNKLKNKKKEVQNKLYTQSKGQKSTIITPNQNLIIKPNDNNNYCNNGSTNKKEAKKIAKNLSRENMYINANNINTTFNNFLLGGTQRRKISFNDNDNNQKNTKTIKLYNINNSAYNDEITLINNNNANDIYTTNYTTKNNRNNIKNTKVDSGNKIRKERNIKYINKCKNNIGHHMLNPSMKIDTNNINNMDNNSIINNLKIKKLDIRVREKKIKNNINLVGNSSKKNDVKNIKDIIIENNNKNNVNLISSFKSEKNIHNLGFGNNTFNTNESRKKDSKQGLSKDKIQNLKISQRSSICNEFNSNSNNQSCKHNRPKSKNKVIKLKDVNNNFNYIINNAIHFNSTVKNNSNNNIYITYINNTNASSSKNNSNNKKKGNNNYYNNFHVNKSNSNLILNSNLSK